MACCVRDLCLHAVLPTQIPVNTVPKHQCQPLLLHESEISDRIKCGAILVSSAIYINRLIQCRKHGLHGKVLSTVRNLSSDGSGPTREIYVSS